MNDLELSISEARNKFSEYVAKIAKTNQVIKIIKHSKTTAVLMSIDEYNKIKGIK